jgi:hypothetical protein
MWDFCILLFAHPFSGVGVGVGVGVDMIGSFFVSFPLIFVCWLNDWQLRRMSRIIYLAL